MADKKILIIEDRADIAEVVELRLQIEGYKTVVGATGEDAFRLTKEHHPDLIIIDVMIPPPNGYQVCRMLKDDPEFSKTPIIIITVKGTENDKFWGLESGADEYIIKPYNVDDFVSKVAKLINR